MADNTVLPGTGEIYAADDIDGVKFQRVKMVTGGPGEAVEISGATPVQVEEATTAEILIELKKIRTYLEIIFESD